MAAVPPNPGFGGPNGEPAVQMDSLGEDGQAIPAGDPANMAQANGQNGDSLSEKREKARQFAPRHIQMMALGSSIATGLFFQTGKMLYFSGPVSMLLAFLLMGSLAYAVLITLGEMISLLPVSGGFFTLANRCLSPAAGFIGGWSYWFARSIGFAVQLVAIQNVIAFWDPDTNLSPVWITIFLVVIVFFNLLNVRNLGEIEYWLALTKLQGILVLIVFGLVLSMGAYPNARQLGTESDNSTVTSCSQGGPCLHTPGFDYWAEGAFRPYYHEGPFGRLVGFWLACCQAFFAYQGVDIIGLVAEETERQRETLPRAVRRVAYRIIFYYVGAVFVLGLNVSALDPILANIAEGKHEPHGFFSPFMLMVQRAGFPKMQSFINVIILVAVTSTANTRLYVSSRTLCALAREGQAPKIFGERNSWNVPYLSVAASAIPPLLSFASTGKSVGAKNVYDILQQLLITCAAVSWAVICATYLRFRRIVQVQGMKNAIPPKALSPLQPYLAWYGLAWSILFSSQSPILSSLTIVIFNGYEVFTRHNPLWSLVSFSWGPYVSSWMELVVLVLMFFGWLLYGHVVYGEWSLRIPNIQNADVMNGIAPPLEDNNVRKGSLKKSVSWILNNV